MITVAFKGDSHGTDSSSVHRISSLKHMTQKNASQHGVERERVGLEYHNQLANAADVSNAAVSALFISRPG